MMFSIGIFPFMAAATTLIFFEPDWPVRVWNWIRRPHISRPDWNWFCWGGLVIPVFGMSLGWKDRISGWSDFHGTKINVWLKRFCVAWILVQLLLPFRHNLIAGNAEWTEEGHKFSWRMMLRTKQVMRLYFVVEDPKLQTADSRGKQVIDWSLCPKECSRSIYVPVDSQQYRWESRNGFFPTYEPVLGHRLFYIPPVVGGRVEPAETTRKRIRAHWQSAFDREPKIRETVDLRGAIKSMRAELGSGPSWVDETADPTRTAELLDEIAADLADQLDPTSRENELRNKTVVDLLAQLVELNGKCDVAPVLTRLAPFSIHGAPRARRSCFVVEDPEISDTSKMIRQLVGEKSPYMIWTDITRLQPRAWRALPDWCIAMDGGELQIIWNYHRQLNHAQIRRFSQFPYHLREYARHIAQRWKKQMGNDAKVFVSVQYKFNNTHTAPLIDPDIDLSKVDYSFLKHNDWILPAPERG